MRIFEWPWHTAVLCAELADLARRPHAVLYTGPSGIGKSAYVGALTAALVCEHPAIDGRACGRCAACAWVAAESHPDVRHVSLVEDEEGGLAREIKIDQIRSVQAMCAMHAHCGGRRVVVIDPAETLNVAAANALLKTLEEPGEGLFFLLVSSRPELLPATVRSRCQKRVLSGPSLQEAQAWLQAETGCDSAEGQWALQIAQGAPLRARFLIEPDQSSAYRTMVQVILGLADSSVMEVADALHSIPTKLWLPVLQCWWLDLGRVLVGIEPHYFPEHASRLGAVASRTDVGAVARVGRALAQHVKVVEHPLNARLLCEHIVSDCFGAFSAT